MTGLLFPRLIRAVTSWPFIVSLCLLLLNDLYLKPNHPSFLTGKLSDFSGVCLIAWVLFALFPRRVYSFGFAIAVLFYWWKSPYSDGLIRLIQKLGAIGFGRVVDYSDLIALLALPLAYWLTRVSKSHEERRLALKRLVALPVIASAALAIMGTSVLPIRDKYEIRKVEPPHTLDAKLAATLINDVAERHDLKCAKCDNPTVSAEYSGNSITMRYEIKTDRIFFEISGLPGFPLFSSVPGRVDALRKDLNRELGANFSNLEFVVPLPEQRR